jgi:hypothetical protein
VAGAVAESVQELASDNLDRELHVERPVFIEMGLLCGN